MSVRGIFVVLIACAIYLLCFFPYMDKWYDKAKQFCDILPRLIEAGASSCKSRQSVLVR